MVPKFVSRTRTWVSHSETEPKKESGTYFFAQGTLFYLVDKLADPAVSTGRLAGLDLKRLWQAAGAVCAAARHGVQLHLGRCQAYRFQTGLNSELIGA